MLLIVLKEVFSGNIIKLLVKLLLFGLVAQSGRASRSQRGGLGFKSRQVHMAVLIASLGAGKGSWSLVGSLMNSHDWSRIILVGDDFAAKFSHDKKFDFVLVSESLSVQDISNIIDSGLGSLGFDDVAVNLVSGSGVLHMAILIAILRKGCGLRFVTVNENGVLIELS